MNERSVVVTAPSMEEARVRGAIELGADESIVSVRLIERIQRQGTTVHRVLVSARFDGPGGGFEPAALDRSPGEEDIESLLEREVETSGKLAEESMKVYDELVGEAGAPDRELISEMKDLSLAFDDDLRMKMRRRRRERRLKMAGGGLEAVSRDGVFIVRAGAGETTSRPEPPPAPTRERWFDIIFGDDDMEAFLVLKGRPPDSADRREIEACLSDMGVIAEPDMEAIERVIGGTEPGLPIRIASGVGPVRGKDGRIEFTYEFGSKVARGVTLAKIVPPEPGIPGRDIFGSEIPAEPGRPCPLKFGPGIRHDEAGGRLIADIAGRLSGSEIEPRVDEIADAGIRVIIPDDAFETIIEITPSVGDGEPATVDACMKALAGEKVVFGIDEGAARDLVDKMRGAKVPMMAVVARGVPAEDPVDGRVEIIAERHPDARTEMERVDHRERLSLANVEEGDLLAVYHPPVPGKDGRNVYGTILPARRPKDEKVSAGRNVRMEGSQFFAASDGLLSTASKTISVNPVFTVVGDLDYGVGNIDFNGTVIVGGSVLDGFRIRARGDIEIGGNIGSAFVEAGGDIRVGGGILGRFSGRVVAGGKVETGFIENAFVEGRGGVSVGRSILHSRVRTNGWLKAVLEKGMLTGGESIALEGVMVKVLGAPAGTFTEVRVGEDYNLTEEYERASREYERAVEELERITIILRDAKREGMDDLSRLEVRRRAALARLIREKMRLKKEIKDMGIAKIRSLAAMRRIPPGRVEVKEKAYPGSRIYLSRQAIEIVDEMGASRFHLDDEGDIVIDRRG